MKTETIIVEENIKLLKQRMQTFETNARRKGLCISHKASCQRFLEFLEKDVKSIDAEIKIAKKHKAELSIRVYELWKMRNNQKITDLKNAIKKYDEVGI